MKKKIFLLLFLLVLSCHLLAWEKDSVLDITRFAYDKLPTDIQIQINKDKFFEGVRDMQDGKHRDIFGWGFVYHPSNNFGDCPDGIQNLTDKAIAENDTIKRSYIIGGLTGYTIYLAHPLHTASSEKETKSKHLLIDRTSEDIVRNITPSINIESQPIADIKKFAQDIAIESNLDYEKLLDVYKDKEQLKEITESAVNRAVRKSNEIITEIISRIIKGDHVVTVPELVVQSAAQPLVQSSSPTAIRPEGLLAPAPLPIPSSDVDERVNAAVKASAEARALREKLLQEEAQQTPSAEIVKERPVEKKEIPKQAKAVVPSMPAEPAPETKVEKQIKAVQHPQQVSILTPVSVGQLQPEQPILSQQTTPTKPEYSAAVIPQSATIRYREPVKKTAESTDFAEQNIPVAQSVSAEFTLSPQAPNYGQIQRQTLVAVPESIVSRGIVKESHPYINWDEPHKIGKARITFVYDGDTLTTARGTKIRLLGLDTPEIKPLQSGAIEAVEFTKKFVLDKEVDVVTQKEKDKDKYNRTLAFIFVNNKCLNFELIKNGHAKVRYVDGIYKPTSKLINLDKWRPDYVPPRIAVDTDAQTGTPVFSEPIPPPSFFELEKSQQQGIGKSIIESPAVFVTPTGGVEKTEIYSVAVPQPQVSTVRPVVSQTPVSQQQGQTPIATQQQTGGGIVGSIVPMVPFVLYQPKGAVLNPDKEYIMRFVPDGNGRYYMDVSEK